MLTYDDLMVLEEFTDEEISDLYTVDFNLLKDYRVLRTMGELEHYIEIGIFQSQSIDTTVGLLNQVEKRARQIELSLGMKASVSQNGPFVCLVVHSQAEDVLRRFKVY